MKRISQTHREAGCTPLKESHLRSIHVGGAVSNRKLLFGCAMRGRNPDNPKDRKTKSNGTFRQMIEIGKFGISNTITSVQKDSMVAEVRKKNKCSDCQGHGTGRDGLSISTSVTLPIRFTRK